MDTVADAEMQDPLEQLAAFHGIETRWVSASGRTERVEDAVLARVLAILGVTPSERADAARLLAEAETAAALRPLPPVVVDRSGGRAVTVDLRIPARTGPVAWTILLETGGEIGGMLHPPPDRARAQGGEAPPEGVRRLKPGTLPLGYHRLRLDGPLAETRLIVAPPACFAPQALREGRRLSGLAAQLYLLRSTRDWGIGDFADLLRLVRFAAGQGSDILGLNPLHALFADEPEAASPYSPASRLLLNPLYVAIDALPPGPRLDAFLADPQTRRRVEAAREARLVDYAAVAGIKRKALRCAFDDLLETDPETGGRAALEAFMHERGAGLLDACLHLAMRAHFAAGDPPRPDWREWPEEYRSPTGRGVLSFVDRHGDAVLFEVYCQYVADAQLAATAKAARDAGMEIGLYRDLAVGCHAAGAETWADQRAVVSGATVGAPPDIFIPEGQDWGLPPFHPTGLAADGYGAFVDLLRANMRHAGALRIDHVMGLQRLWWVPAGEPASRGAFVRYPVDDLLGVLALESHRNRCMVVGEDLGTVPQGFREKMAAAGVLSYRVLLFEQDFDTSTFTPADDWPAAAVAVSGSHDLPTLRGWWLGRDNDLKESLGLFPRPGEAEDQRRRRERDRAGLVRLLARAGLLEPGSEPDADAFCDAAGAFVARTASAVALVQVDDLTGEVEPVNVPSTRDEHPNWRRRYRLRLEELERHPPAVLAAFADRGEGNRDTAKAFDSQGIPRSPKAP